MTISDIAKLAFSIVLCEGAGVIGGIFTAGSIPVWYAALRKPPFTPPNWVFGPVWITLYLLMGIAVFLIWRRGLREPKAKTAFIVFWIQLAFNVLWSIVFFGLQSIAGGLAVIIVLWLLILLTIILSLRVSRVAGIILIPYILWVSIATYLNVGIWMLMITFGAAFGYTVMGRIALLGARLEFLLDNWLWLIDPTGRRVVATMLFGLIG